MISAPEEIARFSSRSLLAGFPELTHPHYPKYCISNVGATVRSSLGLGGRNPICKPDFSPEKVVLIVVDALGCELLSRAAPKLAERALPITSVFPSTTASAYTSLVRGAPPSLHGITGYWLAVRKKWLLQTIEYRRHFPDKRPPGIDPEKIPLESAPILIQELLGSGIPCKTLVRKEFVGAPFSKILGDQSEKEELLPFSSLSEFAGNLRKAAEAPGPSFTFAYWEKIDQLSHSAGPESDRVAARVRQFFSRLKRELGKLPRESLAKTLFLITADHGQVPVSSGENRLHYAADPKLPGLISLPPAGDNRAVYLYARRNKIDELGKYLQEESPFFSRNYLTIDSKRALEGGLFGPLPKSSSEKKIVLSRVGDFVLLARNNAQLGHTERSALRGNHGSLTEKEAFVPLLSGKLGGIFP